MATEDLSRAATSPRKRYAGVRMQQGRVLTDDDFNEAGILAAEELRRSRIDVIGPSGSPDTGFRVSAPTMDGSNRVNFQIEAGTIYVGGLRAHLPEAVSFDAQPDWLGQRDADRTRDTSKAAELVYLEVWEQPVGAVEDDELFEKALGGPDTTTRVRTMARVRRVSVDETECHEAWEAFVDTLDAGLYGAWSATDCGLDPDVRLRVDYDLTGVTEDLCSPSVTAGYLGAENAAIRVQLVDPAGIGKPAAITWSYENASSLYRVEVAADGQTVTFLTEPKDQAHWPLQGQTVEILPWSAMLDPNRELLAEGHGRATPLAGGEALSLGNGHLTTLSSGYDSTARTVTLTDALPAGFNQLATAHAGAATANDGTTRSYVFLRVWNRGSAIPGAARLGITPDVDWVSLGNTGLRVQVRNTHVNADAYWIVAARPNTPDTVVPWELEAVAGRAPNGVRTHLVPLAVLTWDGTDVEVHDCRETFRPLTRLQNCCRYTVGDGEESHGDFDTIQAAVDNLPAEGGDICVLPGEYAEPVEIRDRTGVRIHGCGSRSRVVSTSTSVPAIRIVDSDQITIEGLAIASLGQWGIAVVGEDATPSDVRITRNRVTGRDYGAIVAVGVRDVVISENRIVAAALDAAPSEGSVLGRVPSVFVQGDDIRVRGNRIEAEEAASPAQTGLGGVQVGGNSSEIHIRRNRISGGNGNGITLGSIGEETTDGSGWFFLSIFGVPYYYWEDGCLKVGWISWVGDDGEPITKLTSDGPLDDIHIRGNRVTDQGGDGVGVAYFFDDLDGDGVPDDLVVVENLYVVDNRISRCATAERASPSSFLRTWSGHGGIALADTHHAVIRRNHVTGNGASVNGPTCGIFVLSGSGVEVSRNRVVGNGYTGYVAGGWQGGILLFNLAAPLDDSGAWDGTATAAVSDNHVSARQGPALAINGIGPMHVVDNVLTTLGTLTFVNQSAWIWNTGTGNEYFDGSSGHAESPDLAGLVQFTGNQVSARPPATATGLTFQLWNALVYSLDDVQVSDNTFRTDLGVSRGYIDVVAVGRTASVSDNRMRETPNQVEFSGYCFGTTSGVLRGNMGTHCFLLNDASIFSEGESNRSLVEVELGDSAPCEAYVSRFAATASTTGVPVTTGPRARADKSLYQFRARPRAEGN